MATCVELDSTNHLVATTTAPESCTSYIIQSQTDWLSQQSPLFRLTPDQGVQIGGAMVLVLAIAWGFRMLIRVSHVADKGDSNEE